MSCTMVAGIMSPYVNLEEGFFLFGLNGVLHLGAKVSHTNVDFGPWEAQRKNVRNAFSRRYREIESELARLQKDSLWETT